MGKTVMSVSAVARGVIGHRTEVQVQIPDGLWLATNTISDSLNVPIPLEQRGCSETLTEEVFVIQQDYNPDFFMTYLTAVSYLGDVSFVGGMLAKEFCWVSHSPFAILVRTTITRGWKMDTLVKAGRPRSTVSMRLVWSRQINNGELGMKIPVVRMRSVAQTKEPRKYSWVSLMELSEHAKCDPYKIISHFISLGIFGIKDQPAYVFAESEKSLAQGTYKPSPKIFGEPRSTTSFLSSMPRSTDEVPLDHVWVSALAAKNILRIISLGVVNGKDQLLPHVIMI